MTLRPFGKTVRWFHEHGYNVPTYDIYTVRETTLRYPKWIHFGAGNIFRAFIAQLVESLLNVGVLSSGLIAVEGFDYEIVDLVYKPYDNFAVVLEISTEGMIKKSLVGSISCALKADPFFEEDWTKLRRIFASESLELVSFTVTEKAYTLNPEIIHDSELGPLSPKVFLTKLLSLLLERYKHRLPLTMISFDNFSHNSMQLKNSLLKVAEIWATLGYINDDFIDYIDSSIHFPITVIDKIVPAPAQEFQNLLKEEGLNFNIHTTEKGTKIAAFVNAELYQYMVIERCGNVEFLDHPDALRNVFVTKKEEVERFEKMKVSACLNPVHTATALFGVLLGHSRMDEAISEPLIKKVAYNVAWEAMSVIESPSFVDPITFLEEVIEKRIANPYIPDSPFRITTDTSQKFPVRFGRTLRKYCVETDRCLMLKFVPLVIAGWLRYLLAIDDYGRPYTPSPDPELHRIREALREVKIGEVDDRVKRRVSSVVTEILKDERIFTVDLSNSPIRRLVESLFLSMISCHGAVRKTLETYLESHRIPEL